MGEGDEGYPAAESSDEGGSREKLAVVGQPVGMDGSLGQGEAHDLPAGVGALLTLGSPAAADVNVGGVAGALVGEAALVLVGVPSVVDDCPIAAILKRAEVVGRQRSYIGFYEFVAFAVMRKRRLFLQLGDSDMDVVSVLAPQLLDASWNMVPFATQVVLCKFAGKDWVMSGVEHASHFMAAIPVGRRHDCKGSSVCAHCLRNGFAVLPTVLDGDCGLDALNIVEGRSRGLIERQSLRAELRAFMIRTAGDPLGTASSAIARSSGKW